MDKDFFEFISSLFNVKEEKTIIRLVLEDKTEEEIIEILINYQNENKNV